MSSPEIHNPPKEHGVPRFAAIILAAGYSSRMVRLKPLLPLAGSTVIEHVIELFRKAGISDIVVVLGHRAEELQPTVELAGATCAFNPYFEQGMYSSVQAGVRTLPPAADAAFVLPVDIPLVRANTLHLLQSAFTASGKQIIYPVFQGERGHPPLIAHSILRETLNPEISGPFCNLLQRHENKVCDAQVADEAIHLDMDTPADYARICSLEEVRDIPSSGECESILSIRGVAPPLLHHLKAVANIACSIALALNEKGFSFNIDLIRASGLLHDISKGMPDHAHHGAALLRSMGFSRVAEVVASHMEFDFSDGKLSEAALIYLADKLVRGDTLITLNQRFRPAFTRFRYDTEALKGVKRRLVTARKIAVTVEKELGIALGCFLHQHTSSIPSSAVVWQPTCIPDL